MRKAHSDLARNSGAEPGTPLPLMSFDHAILAAACAPGANVLAVWLRSALLESLVRQGLLTPLGDGDQLEDNDFEVAATFPIGDLNQLDMQAFIQQFRKASETKCSRS
jgi:hypothetical protein